MKKIRFTPLFKDTFRTIKYSITRFLAIVIMTALASAVFIGLKTTGPNIKYSVKQKSIEHNMYDIKIFSYASLRDEDKKIIEDLKSLDKVEYVISDDFMDLSSKRFVNLISLTDEIQIPLVTQGRLPEKKNEILVDDSVTNEYKIGDHISLKNKKESIFEEKNVLNTTEYEIVGFGKSMDYLVIKRGKLSLNPSKSDFFAFVKKEVFNSNNSDYALLKFKDLSETDPLSKKYKKLEISKVTDIKSKFKNRPDDLLEELRKDAVEKISNAEKDINEADEKIKDARKKLNDAKSELEKSKEDLDNAKSTLDTTEKDLETAKKTLDETRIMLDDGWKEYRKNSSKFKSENQKATEKIISAKKELNDANEKLNKAKSEYEEGLKKYNGEFEEFQKNKILLKKSKIELIHQKEELENAIDQLHKKKLSVEDIIKETELKIQDLVNTLPEGEESQEVKKLKKELESLKISLEKIESSLNMSIESLKKIKENIDLIFEKEKNLEEGEKKLVAIKKELEKSKIELKNGEKEYKKNLAIFNENLNKLNSETEIAQAKLDKVKKELNDSEYQYNLFLKKYSSGKIEYQEGLEKYNNGLIEYKKGLDEYNKNSEKFNSENLDAEKKITKAKEYIKNYKKHIENLKIPHYEITGKYDDPVFFNYNDQAESVDNLSYIFTAMFYLVAILVTLTTILRMVDMERGQMGTLKALGYSRSKIRTKYLTYGLISGILGTSIGIVFGFYSLRLSVFKAYTAEVDINTYHLFNPIYILVIYFITIVAISLTVILSVNSTLRESSASLMRPKPPKKNRRLVLEKLHFIWNKMSFLSKVSARNIFRHKIRVLMTILGVAGSFGLISMGYGIKSSVEDLSEMQYGNVYKYDIEIIYDENDDNVEDLEKFITENSKDSMSGISQKANITNKSGFSEIVKIYATDDDKINNFISLNERGGGKTYALEKNHVIVSEKLAYLLGLNVGDNIVFRYKDGLEYTLPISNITEQYSGHLIYMTKSTFVEKIDPTQKNNSYMIILNSNKTVDEFDDNIQKMSPVISTIQTVALKSALDNLTKSLYSVVLLIITISSLLTFVILYNLTNINISERVREISTIKVLGFRTKELISYVFSENFTLTVVGMIIGVAVGKMMHYIIVFTLSPSALLFDPKMRIMSFVYAAVIILIFTALVVLITVREVKKIDMVEALKSVD